MPRRSKDVQEFHATYYRPDNATLVVVGDFDPKQLDAWVDKYFAPIAKPNRPLPRVQVKEPPRKSEIRLTEYGSNDLPAVGLTYLTPRQADPDSDALRVADAILSAGESSRLYNSLVYTQQLAAEVNSNAETREDVSLFVLTGGVVGRKESRRRGEVDAGRDQETCRTRRSPRLSWRKPRTRSSPTSCANVRRATEKRSRSVKLRCCSEIRRE